MIDKISFKNYKPFRDFQELELKKITVLIGKNSSGKSAIAKLPTLIENSLSGTFDEPLLPNNNYIELGAEFSDLIYGRSPTGILEICLENQNKKLELSIASGTGTKDFPKIISWQLKHSDGSIFKMESKHNFKGFILQSENTGYSIKDLNLFIEYIGPFRVLPERGYNKPNTSKIEKIGITGESTYSLLIQDSLTIEESLIKKINSWYQKNFEGWGIRVNQDKEPFYQIELTRDFERLNINIKDVGEGMSQALPLVTRALMQTVNEILIIIEQPELHLHPGAHGNLAELFVDSLKEGNKKYLIETHSQNFVLRLRRLVAEGKLDKNDLMIYFVDFDEENSTSNLRNIIVDDSGEVNYWPENVFNESLDEAIAIRKAQKRKN